MKGIAIRVIRQLRGDKRTIAMILFAPIFMFTLIFFLLGDTDYVPTVALREGALPAAAVAALDAQDVHRVDLADYAYNSEAELLIGHKEIDLAVTRDGMAIDAYILESTVKSARALQALQAAVTAVSPAASLRTHAVYNEGASTFQSLGFVFLGFLSFFFVFVISGLTLVRERTGGTLERLMMTPVRRWEVMTGYMLGYGFFAVLQTALIVAYTLYVLHLPCAGSVWLVFLLMLVNAVVAVLFGSMVSIMAATELQMVQFIPVLIIPQVFFCGLIPLDTIPLGLGYVAYITPVYYSSEAIRRVLVEGAGIPGIWPYALAMLGYGALLWTVNTLALKKFRTL